MLIVGNVRTRTETIERELQIKPGDPLSLEAVNESQRRLAALGLFRRARITELRHGDETTRDLLVTVEEAPATTVGYGGGFEAVEAIGTNAAGFAQTEIDFAPRAFVEISAPEPVRQEPVGEFLRQRQPVPQRRGRIVAGRRRRRLRLHRVPRARHLPRAARVRARAPTRS